jgi:hypothetical protein
VSLGVSRVAFFLAGAVAALVLAGPAAACVCVKEPMSQRLDESDAALVGRIVAQRPGQVEGAPVAMLTVEVDQRVKGKLESPLRVRSPRGSDCDVEAPMNQTIGLLLTKAPDGAWLASACSVVLPGPLVAAGGEPRGGVIKVGVGILILILVLLWGVRRLRKGARPDLPGAPRP